MVNGVERDAWVQTGRTSGLSSVQAWDGAGDGRLLGQLYGAPAAAHTRAGPTRRVVVAAGVGTALGALLAPAVWPAPAAALVSWPTVALIDGRTRIGAPELQGRAVVLVFWATHCPFCRRHNPHIEKLHRAAMAMPGQPLQVLSVARDRDAAFVQRYVQQQGYSFPVTMDYAGLAAATSMRNTIPLTVTVPRHGRIAQVIPGEMFEEDVLELLPLLTAKA